MKLSWIELWSHSEKIKKIHQHLLDICQIFYNQTSSLYFDLVLLMTSSFVAIVGNLVFEKCNFFNHCLFLYMLIKFVPKHISLVGSKWHPVVELNVCYLVADTRKKYCFLCIVLGLIMKCAIKDYPLLILFFNQTFPV